MTVDLDISKRSAIMIALQEGYWKGVAILAKKGAKVEADLKDRLLSVEDLQAILRACEEEGVDPKSEFYKEVQETLKDEEETEALYAS